MLSGCRRPAGVAVIAYLVAMYLAVAAFLMVEEVRRPLKPSDRIHAEARPLLWWSALVGLCMVWPLSIYFLEEP